ncbi:MAG: aldo/keto reductase [Thermoprotei archaeon]
MRKIELGKTSEKVSVIGYGTYRLGGGWKKSDFSKDDESVDAIRTAASYGSTFIDTAEAYGAGHSEELVGKAVSQMISKGELEREDLFIATKVSEEHLSYDDVIRSCNQSLRRLGVEQIDLYQIHWPNPHIKLSETMRAMEDLVKEGKVRYLGVCNFSVELFEEARQNLAKQELHSDQVSYSVFDRAPEESLLGFCKREHITLIAYSPLGAGHKWQEMPKAVLALAERYNKSPAQIALNWLLSRGPVLPIPKAGVKDHIRQNCEAADFELSAEEYAQI